jgi:antitoxin component YwqK of YwqJK toxin-antitoxin module
MGWPKEAMPTVLLIAGTFSTTSYGGAQEYWRENGTRHLLEHWFDGKRHGIEMCWFKSGKLRYQIEWCHDVRLYETFYYSNGQMKLRQRFINGEVCSIEHWDQSGNPFSGFP